MEEVLWVKCVISRPVSALVRWVALWAGFKTDFLCTLITSSLNYHCCLFFHQNNSAGLLCNECKSGFFYLTSSNPQGCTNCVCMGISSNCSSTMDYRTQVVVIIWFFFLMLLVIPERLEEVVKNWTMISKSSFSSIDSSLTSSTIIFCHRERLTLVFGVWYQQLVFRALFNFLKFPSW